MLSQLFPSLLSRDCSIPRPLNGKCSQGLQHWDPPCRRVPCQGSDIAVPELYRDSRRHCKGPPCRPRWPARSIRCTRACTRDSPFHASHASPGQVGFKMFLGVTAEVLHRPALRPSCIARCGPALLQAALSPIGSAAALTACRCRGRRKAPPWPTASAHPPPPPLPAPILVPLNSSAPPRQGCGGYRQRVQLAAERQPARGVCRASRAV